MARQNWHRSLSLIGRRSSAMRPKAIIWRRCPASAALNVLLAPLMPAALHIDPDTAAKALASRFNRAPLVAARHQTQLGIPPVPKPRRIIALGRRRNLRFQEQYLTKSLRHDSAIVSAAQKPSGSPSESRPSNAQAAYSGAAVIPRNATFFRDSARPSDASRKLGDTGEVVDVFSESCA